MDHSSALSVALGRPAGPGIPGHCPGYFELCVLISRGLDAKTMLAQTYV